MRVGVNAAIQGTNDGLFLFVTYRRLGRIEYVDVSDTEGPTELSGNGEVPVQVVGPPAPTSSREDRSGP